MRARWLHALAGQNEADGSQGLPVIVMDLRLQAEGVGRHARHQLQIARPARVDMQTLAGFELGDGVLLPGEPS